MKELDSEKIFGNPAMGDKFLLLRAQDQLLHAIIIMQFVIENSDEHEVNLRQMQKFVNQFTKDEKAK